MLIFFSPSTEEAVADFVLLCHPQLKSSGARSSMTMYSLFFDFLMGFWPNYGHMVLQMLAGE